MKILGIACCVPKNNIDTFSFFKRFGKESVERVVANIGVKERRIAKSGMCTSDLCVTASEYLFSKTGIDKDTIDCIIFVSQTSDYLIPATSGIIQKQLGLSEKVFTFDVNQGCTGYTDGLIIAQGLLHGLQMKRILLLAGDTISKMLDPNDQGTAMLFGDAGSATLLESTYATSSSDSRQDFCFISGTDGGGADVIMQKIGYRNGFHVNHSISNISDLFVKIDGAKVYEFTIDRVPIMIKELLDKTGWSIDETDSFIFHQANKYIIRNLARITKIPMDKVPICLDEFGNTSSASIPLTMVTRLQERLTCPAKLVLVGFGVGLAWSAVALEWENGIICPLIEMES
jgi:3-oxoacyl-[acyl-carrier-protein] synthase-3